MVESAQISTEVVDEAAPKQDRKFSISQPRSLDVEEATEITGILSRIQELFYENSDFKDGPKAGKVNIEQFKTGKNLIKYLKNDVFHSPSIEWPVPLKK